MSVKLLWHDKDLQVKFRVFFKPQVKSFTPLSFEDLIREGFCFPRIILDRNKTVLARTKQSHRRELLQFLTDVLKISICKEIPLLEFAAMESTLALIWASISLSLFAKPQLLFTTML